jgi:hypothetical protein
MAPVSDHEVPVRQASAPPVFVESKHATSHKPVEPPTIMLTPVPARPPVSEPPPPREPSQGAGRVVLVLILVVIAMVLLIVIISNVASVLNSALDGDAGSGTGSGATPASASRTTPCPEPAVTFLPNRNGAVLVAAYTTDRHVITICRDRTGQVFYDGQLKGAEVNTNTHISLPATATGDGFIARNGTYVYEISDKDLTVLHDGVEISHATPTRTAPG